LLLVVPLPPPMHGSNLMNQHVVGCRELHKHFLVKVLPLHYASTIADIGSLRLAKFAVLAWYLCQLITLMILFRPKVVYFVPAVTGLSFYRDCLFGMVLKSFNCHVLYHLHGKGVRDELEKPMSMWIYRWFFKGSTVILLSRLLYEDVKDVVPSAHCRYVPNGLSYPNLEFKDRKMTEGREPMILFLSNLVPTKGPILLLDACKVLRDRGLKFKTYFVGNPTAAISAEVFSDAIKRRGLQHHVEYLGPRYGEDKYYLLLQSDVLVFPTFRDTFPLVLLEAMAAGLPVISTSQGAIPEIIEHGRTGLIVDCQSVESLADKIEYLILHPEEGKRMGQAGRAKFEQQYTIQRFCRNLIAIIDERFRYYHQARE